MNRKEKISGLRTHISSQGTLFLAGRTDETNEKLMSQIKPNEIVFHTEMAGSPFVNIKGNLKEGDLNEAAIMCARYSRDFKKHKSDTKVHYFFGKNTYKLKSMKAGTFGVKRLKEIIVPLEEIEAFVANPAKKGDLMKFESKDIL